MVKGPNTVIILPFYGRTKTKTVRLQQFLNQLMHMGEVGFCFHSKYNIRRTPTG